MKYAIKRSIIFDNFMLEAEFSQTRFNEEVERFFIENIL